MTAPPKRTPRIRAFIPALLAASLLLPAAALAQSSKGKGPSGPGPTDEDKAKAVDRRNYVKDTDEAYRKSLQRIPDAPKPDPWGGVREAPKK
jgi:hypothetical protein